VAVVPNAVDLDYFTPSGDDIVPGSILFTGLLSYRPNLDAILFFLDEVLPLVRARCPEAVLTVVGHGEHRDLERIRRPGVVVTGRVPDVRPYLDAAAVVAVPLRMGGGTRLKVVEAMAMGKAIVSTSLGCEGINVRDGEHLVVADTPAVLAEAIAALLLDGTRGAELGRRARQLAEEQYSWNVAGAALEQLFSDGPDGEDDAEAVRTSAGVAASLEACVPGEAFS
jgi:glycosyltransferase involved in cell wall biosynthesis